jgi:hypothetical protein
MYLRNIVFAACLALSTPPAPVHAGTGNPVLSVVAPQIAGGAVDFDMAALEAMPQSGFSTSTVWTDGTHEYSGIPLKALLARLGITSGEIKATALNDYSVTIPIDSLEDDAPILAIHVDGKAFSRREKGPVWLIYPFDAAERYRTEQIFGRSIWQLRSLDLVTATP